MVDEVSSSLQQLSLHFYVLILKNNVIYCLSNAKDSFAYRAKGRYMATGQRVNVLLLVVTFQ